jgi:uncharacterized protein (DUF433 family)
MKLNQDVTLSDSGSRIPQHYGEFQMIIDLVVPARTPQMDYLHHPECDASKVADMIRAGKSSSEIARALGVSRFKVSKVIEFLDMVPNPLRLDYLNHPLCPVETAMQLRNAGHTFEEIGEHFGVSHQLARTVLRVYSNTNNIPIPPAKPSRRRAPLDYLRHPKCDASKVAEMLHERKSTAEIARALGVSPFIVGKVTEFLGMVPTPFTPDYLNHPQCPAEKAMQLRRAGHTLEEIGEHFGVSYAITHKVLQAYSEANNIPIPTLFRPDYLNHPRCPAEKAMELRRAGHTLEEIGEHFGVSLELTRRVLRAYSKANSIPIPPAKEHRVPWMDYLQHPKCDASKVFEMNREGKSVAEIARALEVSSFIVGKVIEFLGMSPTPCPPPSSSTSARSNRSRSPQTKDVRTIDRLTEQSEPR